MQYDVIYYWVGGTEVGTWHATTHYSPAILASLRQGGRVAHPGLRSIGAPEGPPRRHELARVGFVSPQ